jgi:hypothetical protein
MERACGFFYSPAIFERFWWPYTLTRFGPRASSLSWEVNGPLT